MPVLFLLFTGMWDFGRALNETARLASAAQAGAQYGAQGVSYIEELDGIRQAAKNDAVDTANALTVTVTLSSALDGVWVGSEDNDFDEDDIGACLFLRVQVTEPFSTWFTYPFVSNPMTLSKRATWPILGGGDGGDEDEDDVVCGDFD